MLLLQKVQLHLSLLPNSVAMEFTNSMLKYGALNRPLIDFFGRFECLGGVFDAASDQRVAVLAQEHPAHSTCLYNGDAANNMQFASPYVFSFKGNKPLRDLVLTLFWGKGVGVLYEASLPLDQLKAKFRKIHFARLHDDRRAYFRFYDPRIFSVFIQNLSPDSLPCLTEGVQAFYCEHAKSNAVKEHVCSGNKLSVSVSDLDSWKR